MKATVVALVPPGVVTLILRTPTVAVEVRLSVALSVVSFVAIKLPAASVTPPDRPLSAEAPVRPVPVMVTGTEVPRTPVFGLIEVTLGTDRAITVNVTLLVVPMGVATLTARAPTCAPATIAKLAVMLPEFTTLKVVTVTPVLDTLMAVVPVRFVPESVTATVEPLNPVLGAIDVRVGP